MINEQTTAMNALQGAAAPLNVTGLFKFALKLSTSKEALPIDVRTVIKWHAEPTILNDASLSERVSQVRDLQPSPE